MQGVRNGRTCTFRWHHLDMFVEGLVGKGNQTLVRDHEAAYPLDNQFARFTVKGSALHRNISTGNRQIRYEPVQKRGQGLHVKKPRGLLLSWERHFKTWKGGVAKLYEIAC
jgi:hypothetical protein